ncbi:MAG TPA: ABC transporter permease [Candidatus Angelobacter sp.]|nr:ABC transporter permease [Candidatus Angelobacter sp.]
MSTYASLLSKYPAPGASSPWRAYVNEARFDLLKMLRLPMYSIASIAFPVMFYVLFGVIFGKQGGQGLQVSRYLLGSYGAFGVIGASLFGFGVGVATERGQGWLQVKRASPMPPSAYFVAKLFTCTTFSVAIVLSLIAVAVTAGGVQLSVLQAAGLFVVLVLGSIPFCVLGLAIAYFSGPNSAPAIVNLLYLPLSFCSGLWLPVNMLPHFLQRIAPLLPPYHLGQLALMVLGYGHGSIMGHMLGLTGSTMIGLGLAWLGFQRDEQKTYG